MKRMGQYDKDVDIYDVNETLLFFRTNNEIKKEKLSFTNSKYGESIGDIGGGIGSDCWIIGGKYTESGKPMMACDPHLIKWM